MTMLEQIGSFTEVDYSEMDDETKAAYLKQVVLGFLLKGHKLTGVYTSKDIVPRIVRLFKDLLNDEVTYPEYAQDATQDQIRCQNYLGDSMCSLVRFIREELTSEQVLELLKYRKGRRIIKKSVNVASSVSTKLGSNINHRALIKARISQARLDMQEGRKDQKGNGVEG